LMVSISSNEPITAPLDAFVMTCSRDGVWPSLAQPATTVSHARTGDPVLASTNNSAAPVP
jgi:D-serine deaminase-like pyridoxal phosphate-dependent protein